MDLSRSSGTTLCSSRATYSQLLGTMSRQLLSISKDGDYTPSPGNLCQSLVTLIVKKCFLMFRQSLLCFSLCPLPLVLSLGSTEKSLTPSSVHPSCRYLYTLMRYPWVCSSPGWTVPALLACPRSRCSSPLINFVAFHWALSCMSMSLLCWGAQNWTQYLNFVCRVNQRNMQQ